MENKNHLPLYGIGPILCIPTIIVTAVAIVLSALGIIPGKINNQSVRIIMLVLGVLLIIEGVVLFFGADVGGNLQDEIKDNRLKTNGSYKFVRNPCYVFFLLLDTGAILIAHNLTLFILPIIFWIEMTIVLKNTEEKWLFEKYGNEYAQYCERVNRLIPWFPYREK